LSPYNTNQKTREAKVRLLKVKGDEDWSVFLAGLLEEAEEARRIRAFEKLKGILTDDEVKSILEGTEEFRKNFRLREHQPSCPGDVTGDMRRPGKPCKRSPRHNDRWGSADHDPKGVKNVE
jgi:hypothetical protein